MPDPQRDQASPEERGVTRDARIEDLLLSGLDHYFAGRHNEAINVWTRVLFLDRSHARARAYIERARSAIAEGQRESDELLQRGVAAFHDGHAEIARRLLTRAAERAGSQQEEALAVLGRIERLEAASTVSGMPAPARRRHREPDADADPSGRPLLWLAFLVVFAALGTIGVLVATSGGHAWSWLALMPAERGEATITARPPLPTPQPGDVALVRARAHFSRGRLTDALAALDEVPRGDRASGEAGALRAEIQRILLEAAGVRPPATGTAAQAGGGQ